MDKFKIYNALVNTEEVYYDIESIKTQIMILETKLLYSLNSKKMQFVVDLKHEYEKF